MLDWFQYFVHSIYPIITKKTQKILLSLLLVTSNTRIVSYSMVISQNNKHYGSVTLEDPAMQYHAFYRFNTTKPDFLPEWTPIDWDFFLLTLYAKNFIPNDNVLQTTKRYIYHLVSDYL